MIRELIRKELAEASVTGNIDGGEGPPKTPYAFSGGRKKDKDKKDKITLAKSMTEIRNRITEIERLVKYNVKLKNEMRFESAQYMKRTKTALGKISEKLVRLSLKVKDLV